MRESTVVKKKKTKKLTRVGAQLVVKKKALKRKIETSNAVELSEMSIPDSPPEIEMDLPSSFLREAADRDALESLNKYQESNRLCGVLVDTQTFLIKLSNKGIRYVDVLGYLVHNRNFSPCNTENEATRVRSVLSRTFEGDEKSMYLSLEEFSREMEDKRVSAIQGRKKEIPARYKLICFNFRKITGLKHKDDMYSKHTTELAWINKNRQAFEQIIELKMSKHSEEEVASAMGVRPGKIGRVIAAARMSQWIEGNASKLILKHAYFKVFHPDGNIARMNENIRVFYRH